MCLEGYTKDNVSETCVDIDECELGMCGTEICINFSGGYKCVLIFTKISL